jgi:hypothetical protein
VKAGEFGFLPDGIAAGLAALSPERTAGASAVFIDEIGFLELEGGGWAPALEILLRRARGPLVISVRDYLLPRVLEKWGLSPSGIFDPSAAPETLLRALPR